MSSIGGFKRRAPTSHKTRRALKKYEPKVVENPKRILFLRGARTSDVVNDAIADLFAITRPYGKKLRKRNAFHPFEGRQHLEFLGFKNDCSLFCFGTDSKKRPHNLVLGRHFDFHVLDMAELGIVAADRLSAAGVSGTDAASVGGRPFFFFDGAEFTTDPTFARLKNLLVDLFRGSAEPVVNLDGCDRVMAFSLRSAGGAEAVAAPSDDCYGAAAPRARGNAVLCLRHYALQKPSAAGGVPKGLASAARLVEIGPNFDFELRRLSFATPAEFKAATRLPRETLATMRSTAANVTTDGTQSLRGQLHVGAQDVGQLNLRRFKAHRRTAQEEGEEGEEGEEAPRKRRRRRRADDAEETRPETDI